MNSLKESAGGDPQSGGAAGDYQPRPASVLEPLDRVPEVIFGVLMAASFTGSISVAESGRAEVETMIYAAFGCNIAWGITDAAMYLLGVATERHRKILLLRRLQATQDLHAAQAMIRDALPERMAAAAGPDVIEGLRRNLLLDRTHRRILDLGDFRAAVAICLLVVLATFPVVVPFLFLHDTALALRLSNLLALATLFIGGWLLGKYAGAKPWQYGLALTAAGAALMVTIIALGG